MKKIIVLFVSLILFLSAIGAGSVLGCAVPYFEPQQTTVHVDEFFTVVAINHPACGCIDPNSIEVLDENCDKTSDKAILVSSKCEGDTLTATYRAVKQGKVTFKYVTCTRAVTILPKPHPMFSFMKLLGFGKID